MPERGLHELRISLTSEEHRKQKNPVNARSETIIRQIGAVAASRAGDVTLPSRTRPARDGLVPEISSVTKDQVPVIGTQHLDGNGLLALLASYGTRRRRVARTFYVSSIDQNSHLAQSDFTT